ncbi:uncharacterized protein LOC129921141 [Episyrphus balteatus]|uniref:uncharacterized protein LOC129921141 n=1 Tax=Episyrphus balteatus TaxID=286459 RepID=UPI0024869E83|nr:uncharacterized protein LOC129921141 [Episyrphus balteatus]
MVALKIFVLLATLCAMAYSAPQPGFLGKHEHHIVHVPYKVHTVHHHHVQKVPVIKEIIKEVPVIKHVPIYKEVHVPIYKEVHVPVHVEEHHKESWAPSSSGWY